jgi:mannose-6-phosphate isomerase-like protein (cupin superfamily)
MTDPMDTTQGPRLIGPTDGETMGAAGRQDRFMINSRDTDERFSLVEHTLGPRVLAAPMHRHTREDEYTFVLEGRVGAILGGHEAFAEPGDLLFKPRGEWHTFWNAGDTPARMLEIISSGGLEELFRELDSLTEWPEPEALAGMAARFGCSLDFEATFPVVERHGLEL